MVNDGVEWIKTSVIYLRKVVLSINLTETSFT